jgi:hypothetical protein
MQIENKKYKDTVFRMLFNNKLYLLDLYNAINKTNYTNPDDLMITTLSGETFLKMKNDLSFVIDFELNIFEHQSTPSPNIPLRDLYYLAANLKDLMEACKALKGYSIFVTKVRKYIKEAEAEYNSSHAISLNLMADNKDIMKTLIAKAIEKSIDECIQEDILKDFFTDYRKEIIEVGVHEYSFERHMQIVKDESFDNGVQETTALFSWLKANGRQDDILKAIDDPDYLAKLFKEYEDYKKENP